VVQGNRTVDGAAKLVQPRLITKEFARRYHVELTQPERSDALAHLRELMKHGTLTLLTPTKEPEISDAEVLAMILRR
jgi:uncharacterized protein YeaO (DUF488 family)